MKKILILFILLAIFKTTIAQTVDTSKFNPKIQGYGWTYNRLKIDSGLIVPRIGDTTSKTKGQLRILGNSLCWVGNDGKWYVASTGGGTYTAGYGMNLTSFSFSVDTNLITTKAWHNKGMDSLGAIIATKENALTFNSPLSRSTNTISIPAATTSVNGYLSSTDWNTFNGKESALTFANGLIRTSNTIKVDTGRTTIAIATGGALLKVADSLGVVKLSSVGGDFSGAGGAGYLGFPFQTAAPSTPASGFRFYANSAGLPTWKTSTGTIVTVAGLENTQTFSGAKTFEENTYKIQAFSGYATNTWATSSSNYSTVTPWFTFDGFSAYNSTGVKKWFSYTGQWQSTSSSTSQTFMSIDFKNPNNNTYALGNAKGLDVSLTSQSNAAVTDGRGINVSIIDNVNSIGTYTNSYGMYINQNATSGTKYGYYQGGTGTGVLNYFDGSLTVKTISNGTAGTDSLIVENNGTFKKISPTYYGTSGSGITSLNGLTASTQTFAKVDDTNVTLGIGSATSTHTFTLGWTGTLADSRITSATNWNTAYTNRITSLTTTGSSGAASLSSNTLNIPNYTLTGLGGIANGGGAVSYTVGLIAARPAAGTAGRFYVGTDTGLTYYDTGSAWVIVVGAFTGDVTKPSLSMATVVDGLKGSAIPTLAAGNLKYNGSAWAFDNATYLTANQNVTVTATGDATGTSSSSPTAPSIALTLATVNSNVGSFGSATASPTYTVNGKGLITAASNVTITPAVGSITGLGTGVAAALAVNNNSAGGYATIDGTATLTNKTIGVTQLNGSANTVAVNSTGSTANYTETPYYAVASQTYSGTITWTGTTAPSGTDNHSYTWSRIGNVVFVRINVTFTTAGSALTAVTMTMPTDLPNPFEPPALTANSSILYYGSGGMSVTGTNAIQNQPKVYLRKNSGGSGYEFVCEATSGNSRAAYVNLMYYTN